MKLKHQRMWLTNVYQKQTQNIWNLLDGPTFLNPNMPFHAWKFVDPDALKVYVNGKRLMGEYDTMTWVAPPPIKMEFKILHSGICTDITPGQIAIFVDITPTDFILIEQTILVDE